MELKPIRTKQDHKAALSEASEFFNAQPKFGTPEGDRFEILLMLIENYERNHYPIEVPDPIEAIKFRMEQSELTVKDLVPMIGLPNRVYEVLNGTRPLSLTMIWKLHKGLGIPADALIKPPSAKKPAIKRVVANRDCVDV